MVKIKPEHRNKVKEANRKAERRTGFVQKVKKKLNKKRNQFSFQNQVRLQEKDTFLKPNKQLSKEAKKSDVHFKKGVKNRISNKKSLRDKYFKEYPITSMGDISEEDIDSEDDLSLDEEDLPTPPDTTSSEGDSSEDEANENPQIEVVPEVDDKERRTVFVGNLPKSINKIKLRKWFSKFGDVECVRLRCAPLSDPGIPKKIAVIKKAFHDERSNIHGFVRFTTLEAATSALAANGQAFDENHHLRVDMAGTPGQHKRYDDKKAVFVGNLPFSAEEDQLRDHFADCGDIVCIRIVRDKHTAVGKGFAFINFAARHSVRLAIEKNGLELNGRKLRIQKALYNQEVEVTRENRKSNNAHSFHPRNKCGQGNVTKFKKKKKKNTGDEHEFQGLSSSKDVKRKPLSKKKRKVKKKKETLQKILNTGNKVKREVTF